jgi:hypothetical protein
MASLYTTIIDQTISTSTAANNVDLTGYENFSVLGRLTGPANATVFLEMYNDNLSVAREMLTLNAAGWLNFPRTYHLFAPSMGIVFYNPSAPIQIRMTVYAAI